MANKISSLLDGNRMKMLMKQLGDCLNLDGSVVECGVYKGGSALAMAKIINKTKDFHIFDSFCGMPETTKFDNAHKKGDFSDVSLEEVEELLKDFDVNIHTGFIPVTFDGVKIDKICFLHIDLDIYQAYKDTLEFFYTKLVKDGIIVFDDYGSCLGAKKAVDEFFSDKPESPIKLSKFQYMIKKQ